jgi:hypothetical protein
MRGKRVDKSDPVEHPAILKIFADQDANAGPPSSGPQHRMPECQPMFTDRPHRRTETGGGARLSKHDRLPALHKGRGSFWAMPDFRVTTLSNSPNDCSV